MHGAGRDNFLKQRKDFWKIPYLFVHFLDLEMIGLKDLN